MGGCWGGAGGAVGGGGAGAGGAGCQGGGGALGPAKIGTFQCFKLHFYSWEPEQNC